MLVNGIPARGLESAPVMLTNSATDAIASTDLDGDGRDDLLLGRVEGFFTRLANGTPGIFDSLVEVNPTGPPRNNYLKLADWNGDGLIDAMVGGAFHIAQSDADGRPNAAFTRGTDVPLGFEYGAMLYTRSASGRIDDR